MQSQRKFLALSFAACFLLHVLRITAQKNAAGAKSYFAVSDYLSDKQEITGNWGGRGAVLLGLFGEVDKAAFDHLCDNLDPRTGQKLTAKTLDGRRVGYDFTWSVPKSVSLVHALTGDERVLEAFRASIRDTMGEMEADMQARVRKGGESHDRDTGNMTWAEFVHLTSRPVDGIPCPQLHAHCFVFNATYDGLEDQWKAGQFGKIKQDAYYWQTVQQSRLVNRLQQLGYQVRKTLKDFEIVGVPDSAIKKFSLRTQQIEQRAMMLGVTRPETKAKLGATTREAKNDAIPYSRLLEIWEKRLTDAERNALGDLPKLEAVPARDDARHARFAVEHSFERASVVDERRLLTLALRHGLGEVTPEGIRAEMNRLGLLKRVEKDKTWVTTKDVLAEESRMIAFAVAGKGTMRPLSGPGRDQRLERHSVEHISKTEAATLSAEQQAVNRTRLFQNKPVHSEINRLSDEQQAVINHLLASQDRVMLVRGAAGTGKTTLTKSAVARMGVPVTMLAPTTPAVDVLRKDGFEANTLARFLLDEKLQATAKNGVIWLDEAGLVGTKSMATLFELADRLNARVVLMGDKRQLASVERGSPLRVLEDIAKLPVGELRTVRRQVPEDYRQAAQLAADGDIRKAFAKLDEMGSIKVLEGEQPYAPLARDYVDAVKAGREMLIQCSTHAEGARVSEEIRDLLRQEKLIGREDHVFEQLIPLKLTEPQRKSRQDIPESAVAQFSRSVAGFSPDKRVSADRIGNLETVFPYWAAYQPSEIRLSVGDVIRTTAKGKDLSGRHAINNGSRYTVDRFDKHGNVVLNNGWTLPKNFAHIRHDYVRTEYGGQGRTVRDVVLVNPFDRERFYTAFTRGVHSVKVYAFDKDDLREAVERSSPRMSATELARKARPQLWRRLRESIARIQQRAMIAAKRAAYEIHQATTGRQYEYAIER